MSATEGPEPSLVLYQSEDGRTRIQCRFEGETLWLTQALIAELFQSTVPTVNEHLEALVSEGEIDPAATIRSFRMVRPEGRRQVSRSIEQLRTKLLESPLLQQQAASNSREQFKSSPDLSHALEAIMDAYDAHTAMSQEALSSKAIREGLLELLLDYTNLYEDLQKRAKGA